MREEANIVAVTHTRLDEAVAVLAAAFTDYPVFTFVLPPDTVDRAARLATVMRYYAWRRLVRGWPLLAVEVDGKFQAVIAANPPHDGTPPPGVEAEERKLIEVLGADAEARRRSYEAASGDDPGVPHFFIGMLGVRAAAQGKGYAARLMREIQARSKAHADSQGVALCTESASNLPFYERLGYRVTAEADVGTIHTWAMWRPND